MIANYDYEIEKMYHPENFDSGREEHCIYGDRISETEVIEYCSVCLAPLCSFCGYIVKDARYCNEDYKILFLDTGVKKT